ncbi:unnamed protein product [Parascedosporium putredinis]|uniref:Uncharacterized protein n=1 Tax=Parascedosporium putredinis TaxID=1442378 RepID=A0A9P1GXA5_9PEZI|nr:unnamed protein product [Parascedosporium putredinis]CAI7989505.1 unnamed protein product [Parascedosporium putredinis]
MKVIPLLRTQIFKSTHLIALVCLSSRTRIRLKLIYLRSTSVSLVASGLMFSINDILSCRVTNSVSGEDEAARSSQFASTAVSYQACHVAPATTARPIAPTYQLLDPGALSSEHDSFSLRLRPDEPARRHVPHNVEPRSSASPT